MVVHAAFGDVINHLMVGGIASFIGRVPGSSMDHALSMNWMQKPKK